MSCFQSAVVALQTDYPKAVVWSEENLVAVACGAAVIILNPHTPKVRGVITVPSSNRFPTGKIDVDGGGADLLNGCLLPYHLSRETRPCVRLISWSPAGLAKDVGLLALCTTSGHVKLYRRPHCSPEWIEVVNISEVLYNYYKSTNFGECQIVPLEGSDVIPRQDTANKGTHLRRQKTANVVSEDHENLGEKNNWQIVSSSFYEGDPLEEVTEDCLPLISAQQYASRNEMLMSLIIAWSPILETFGNDVAFSVVKIAPRERLGRGSQGSRPTSPHCGWVGRDSGVAVGAAEAAGASGWVERLGRAAGRRRSSAMAAQKWVCDSVRMKREEGMGMKKRRRGVCGKISLWRVRAPDCYSTDNAGHASEVRLFGLEKAHDSWITAISWVRYGSNDSMTQFALATGSSDGRCIWLVNGEKLLKASEVINDSLSLLREAATVDSSMISVLSLTVPARSPTKLFLAIGKSSGSFELCTLDTSTGKFDNIGCYNAHDSTVSGLAWAFDGRLYSCSQFVGESLSEVPLPRSSPGLKSSTEFAHALDSCFGLSVSPGNLAVTVVRRYDSDLLDPMYEGRLLYSESQDGPRDNIEERAPNFLIKSLGWCVYPYDKAR
ncbi:uncharacterized protein LOC121760556 [Salvia splendens]|uniref:uncharacterized protein LOC121760556 n=1 Tax=Salvia splendens TaxID=180675 RepID=UPI001C279EE5|nr:uncharacterized protein LOC121760556 [Salvia splendens]